MLSHYISLGIRGFRRNSVITALMILAIALGIGAGMTMITVIHAMSSDPMPEKSLVLFVPHLDPLPTNYSVKPNELNPSDYLTLRDAKALLASNIPSHQAAMAGGLLIAESTLGNGLSLQVNGRYTTHDFFSLFDVKLVKGSAWSSNDDASEARVIVISAKMSRQIFGNIDSVGKIVRIGGHDMTVIGIVGNWAPQPKFYADPSGKVFGQPDDFFIPLYTAVSLKLDAAGFMAYWGNENPGLIANSLNDASTSWLQFWVQVNGKDNVDAYTAFLKNYADHQKELGRFQKGGEATRVYGLMQWLQHEKLIPSDVHLQLWLAIAFLFVCMVNIVALLLAKFLRKTAEIGIRRALGARRIDIFIQYGVEAGVIGLPGGVLGLAIAQVGLWAIRSRSDEYAGIARMDALMLTSTLVLAVGAALVTGILPAWRASCVPPAMQLKSN